MTSIATHAENAPNRSPAEVRPARAWVALVARLLLAGVMLYAGAPKVLEAEKFMHAVDNYRLLPSWSVLLTATTLPWIECVAGVSLLLGLWSRASALVVSGLIVVFTAATSSAVIRGLDISCGCFSLEGSDSVTWGQVALHGSLIVPAVLVLIAGPGRFALDGVLRRSKL